MMVLFGWTSAASILASLTALAINVVAESEPLVPVTISHQGPVYWALPIYIADQEGYFDDLKLNVSYEVYSSGAPQVSAAIENKTWDIGAAGVYPNIIGGLSGIETIGLSNDESTTNALVGTATGVANWPPSSSTSPDTNVSVIVAPNTTAHFVVEKCLANEGLSNSLFIFDDPSGVLEALTNGTTAADYGGLWAPDLYLFLENSSGSDILCSGTDADAIVPGGIMVRKEFGDENGETVAKVLAAWFRAIEFIKYGDRREQVLSYMETYYAIYNVSISREAMEKEIDLRPIFTLEEQLVSFERQNGTPSTVDQWYQDVGRFMEETGVVEANPEPETYITDKYIELVRNDSFLRAFALGQDPNATPSPAASPTVPPTSAVVDSKTLHQLVPGIVITAFALLYQ